LAPGSDNVFHKELMMAPMDHLHGSFYASPKSSLLVTFQCQMPRCKWSGSICTSTRATVRSTSKAGTSSASRHSSLLLNTFKISTMRESPQALSRGRGTTRFANQPDAKCTVNWK
jgi:hypothetical protein